MKKLMTHIILNYPNEKIADLVVETLVKKGSNIIELQIPFSDPIADGPTIANACTEVLRKGFQVKTAFTKAKEYVTKYPNVKFFFVMYSNTINNFGIEEFCKQCKKVGVGGLIIPDLPFDSGEGFKVLEQCKFYGLNFIPVVSPNTSITRLKQIANNVDTNLVYATSMSSTTGSTSSKKFLDNDFKTYVQNLRTIFPNQELAIGFGIKTANDVKAMTKYADIVVVGSAIVKLISDLHKTPHKLRLELGRQITGYSKQLSDWTVA